MRGGRKKKEKINTNLAVCEHGPVVALEEAVHQGRHALVEHGRRRHACAAVNMVEGEGVAADLDLQIGNNTKSFSEMLLEMVVKIKCLYNYDEHTVDRNTVGKSKKVMEGHTCMCCKTSSSLVLEARKENSFSS